ncbi:hypothetical protein BDQ17DRAFT_1425638 [Cyathus striatus]|nr:hypothetical protein BDQ17DRAFT_1425638 [Cyathus striatus]
MGVVMIDDAVGKWERKGLRRGLWDKLEGAVRALVQQPATACAPKAWTKNYAVVDQVPKRSTLHSRSSLPLILQSSLYITSSSPTSTTTPHDNAHFSNGFRSRPTPPSSYRPFNLIARSSSTTSASTQDPQWPIPAMMRSVLSPARSHARNT